MSDKKCWYFCQNKLSSKFLCKKISWWKFLWLENTSTSNYPKIIQKKIHIYSNLLIIISKWKLTNNFQRNYNIWSSKFSSQILVSCAVLFQFSWFHSQIQMGNKSFFFSSFFWIRYQFCWITFQNRQCTKIMRTTSRRARCSKQIHSFFTKTMDNANIYWPHLVLFKTNKYSAWII